MNQEDRIWNVYLSGEIHSDWRDEIAARCADKKLPVAFTSPELNHSASDACGEVLGAEANSFWYDHRSAKINSIRTGTLIKDSDIMIVRFGEKYRQWNAAFDAGIAAAIGCPLITLHDESLDHALKEVDASAMATCRNVEQVVQILEYVTRRPA